MTAGTRGMDNQRLLVWALFLMLAWITWQQWNEDYAPKPAQEPPAPMDAPLPEATDLPELGDVTVDSPGGPRNSGPRGRACSCSGDAPRANGKSLETALPYSFPEGWHLRGVFEIKAAKTAVP